MKTQRIALLVLALVTIMLPIEAGAQSVPASDSILSKAVSDQQLTLSADSKTTVVTRCVALQAQLSQLSSKTAATIHLYLDTYGSTINDLQAFELRLARQGVDGSEIDLLIGKMRGAMDSLTIAGSTYTGTLNAVASVDCVNQPEEFVAGIVLARAQLSQLQKSANQIEQLLLDAPSSTFNQIIKRLSA